MIKTKRNPFQFHLILAIVVLFYGFLGVFFLLIMKKQESDLGSLTFLGLGLLLVLFGLYSGNQLIKNAPIISVNNDTISFGKERYQLSQIKKMTLTGQMPYKYIFNHPMEGSYLKAVFNL